MSHYTISDYQGWIRGRGVVCKEQIVDIIADMKGHALDSYLIIISTWWYCYCQCLCCKTCKLHSSSCIVAWLSAGLSLTLQATILLSIDAFIFFLQCYISAHKKQAEDKDNKGRTETKQNTTKRLFVCGNYVYITTGVKSHQNLLFTIWVKWQNTCENVSSLFFSEHNTMSSISFQIHSGVPCLNHQAISLHIDLWFQVPNSVLTLHM